MGRGSVLCCGVMRFSRAVDDDDDDDDNGFCCRAGMASFDR